MVKTRNKAFQILMVLVLMGMVGAGCQTTPTPTPDQPSATKIAYATIKSSAIAYDAVMQALADLDKQGKLTANQKLTVINYGEKFWAAYHTAVDALIAFKRTGGDGINLESALSTLVATLTGFLKYTGEITK